MSETTCVRGVVETAITDDQLEWSSHGAGDMVAEQPLSKAVMKAFRRAKKASNVENVRARGIVSMLRAKREYATEEPKMTVTTCDNPSTGGQASIFDF